MKITGKRSFSGKKIVLGRKRASGIYNQVYYPTVDGESIAVKVGKKWVPSHKKRQEYTMLRLASRKALAPNPLFFDESDNFLAMQRIRGRRLGQSNGEIARLARFVSKMHETKFVRFGLPNRKRVRGTYYDNMTVFLGLLRTEIELISKTVNQTGYLTPQLVGKIVDDYSTVQERIELNREKLTGNLFSIVHFDLHFGNILQKKGDLKAIDWEHAQIGDPVVDVARIFVLNRLSEPQKKVFLDNCSEASDSNFRFRLSLYEDIFKLYQRTFLISRNRDMLLRDRSEKRSGTEGFFLNQIMEGGIRK